MAATAGLPLSLSYDEDPSNLHLSESEDDLTPPVRSTRRIARDQEDVVRRKTEAAAAAGVPLHPIPAMQAAFSESLVEATNQAAGSKPKFRIGDAKQRRSMLLEGAKGSKLHNDLWRYRPGQEHHELWKLLAQISFGVYLLLGGIANSNEQVVTILQGHIDEVDEFLETTMEDINLAIKDVKDRIEFLKLPMANMGTFEKMLEDRNFRLQIVTGNEKIEHIISRTTKALDGTLDDVEEGLKAVKEFAIYLGNEKDASWRQERPDIGEIYDAMTGNAEGWWKALSDLQDSTSVLDGLLVGLGRMVAEMDQRAGEVSRRTRFSVAPYSGPAESPSSRHSSVRSPQASSRRASDVGSSQTSTRRTSEAGSGRRASETSSGRRASEAGSARRASEVGSTRSSGARSQSGSHQRLDRASTNGSQRSSNSSSASSAGGILLQPSVFQGTTTEHERDVASPKDEHKSREPLAIVDENLELDDSTDEAESPAGDGLFILQPRTYTPLPPEPLPSPMVQDRPMASNEDYAVGRTSLRQRVSQKGGNVPNRIQISTGIRHAVSVEVLPRDRSSELSMAEPKSADLRSSDIGIPNLRQGSAYLSPTVYRPESQRRPDSAAAVGNDRHSRVNSVCTSLASTNTSTTTDTYRHSNIETMVSPTSDRQFYRPVQASPHSPLQQRPWTALGPAAPNNHQHHALNNTANHHQSYPRHQPSRMGMSMVTAQTQQTDKTLKKKRSAFGWLKKAFALDESERAEFEARKAQQYDHDMYNEQRARKFLDGKRLPEYQRYQNYQNF